MPTTATKQGITLPTFGDTPAVPTDLLNLWNDVISRAIPRYASTAQRDTEWPSPTAGQVSVTTDTMTVWFYTTSWRRVWSPPVDWTSTGLVVGSGQTLQSVQYMVDSSREVHWRGEVYGASAPAQNGILVTIPSSIQPPSRIVDTIAGLGGSATAFIGGFGGTGDLTTLRFRSLINGAWPSSGTTAMSLAGLHWSLD